MGYEDWDEEKCSIERCGELKDNTSGGKAACECGENLFMSSYIAHWDECIQEWFDEEQNYTYGIGPAHEGAMIGHYTQMEMRPQCTCETQEAGRWKMDATAMLDSRGNEQNAVHVPYKAAPPCHFCPNDCDDGLCTNPCRHYDTFSNCEQMKDYCFIDAHITKNCGAACNCTTQIK
ncbi:cysteine-rich venom protein VAR11-like [Ambystoma mexicanum]|uniref:cysteine-rich venom protein VAR11-like n=1 Tax=Ambystoma mexicanum TaxID=8296 RepID=UPI0037E7CC85